MKTLVLIAASLLPLGPAAALSLDRPTPGIHFPAGHDPARAERLQTILCAEPLRYLGGLTSFWEPHFATTLTYDGDSAALNSLLAELHKVPGLSVRITFSPDLSKEAGSALRAGSFWVTYSHTAPDTLTLRINLAAEKMKDLALLLPKDAAPLPAPDR